MIGKILRSILLTMLLLLALSAIPVLAAPDSPETAVRPSGDWVPISPGEKHWYTFGYTYDEDRDEFGNKIFVDLTMEVANTVDFDVWSTETIRQWGALEEVEPVGKGTYLLDREDDNFNPRVLQWVGGSTASDTYYVIVENRSQEAGYYLLKIEGVGVSFPQGTFEIAAPPAPEAVSQPQPVIAEASVHAPGYGPNEALAPINEWDMLQPSEIRWYTFKYYGTPEEDDQTQATVELMMDVQNAVGFEVWTAAQIPLWIKGDDIEPIGVGTYGLDSEDDNFNPKALSWVGASPGLETYYIIVKNNLDGMSNFQLSVTGPDVAFK